MIDNFRLIMIGAMYENGGNTTHRFLDGHHSLNVYPFESQLGTRHVDDAWRSMFPQKYRWPEFLLDATAEEDFEAIIDEEVRVRSRTPHVSKFRHVTFDFSDNDRKTAYLRLQQTGQRSRANNVEAFLKATFSSWTNRQRSGQEEAYVGYSPAITIDYAKILSDFPLAHFIHVIRNPWSAYADTKKRPLPMSLESYMAAWNVNQSFAIEGSKRYPERFHIIRTEDLLADSVSTLMNVLSRMGLEADDALKVPSWNSEPLEEVFPWGTIRRATPESNVMTALELRPNEVEAIREIGGRFVEQFDYENLV